MLCHPSQMLTASLLPLESGLSFFCLVFWKLPGLTPLHLKPHLPQSGPHTLDTATAVSLPMCLSHAVSCNRSTLLQEPGALSPRRQEHSPSGARSSLPRESGPLSLRSQQYPLSITIWISALPPWEVHLECPHLDKTRRSSVPSSSPGRLYLTLP